ncbi:PIN domain-like protein [Mucor mucedo]|uniref:PIN domain-like protein n=1 Tax=Mucor mucedo TaxID=29922 RepID=UPI00221E5597|nr:PIN domain-like protein [Mucor mucedo]KAI7892726.1 PIN domain-like protein [Mucor mucedo]
MKGIHALSPLLEKVQKPIHIKELSGKRVAVDGHGWLLAGALPHASELARGVETNDYITFFIGLISMLRLNNVTPIVVFNGQTLPMKQHMENVKTKQRKTLIERGNNLYEKGKVTNAKKCYERAFVVTQTMVAKIIRELDRLKVQHVVAPYESEPQLAYMLMEKQVDAVISDKTEVLAYGASKVVRGMDRNGHGQFVDQCRLLRLVGLNAYQFIHLCILSGSDAFSALPGVAFKTALGMVRRHRTIDELLAAVQKKYQKRIADNYTKRFKKINDAHMYQFVYNMNLNVYRRMYAVPNGITIQDPGKTPDYLDIPMLRTNNAIVIDPLDVIRDENKENLWPWDAVSGQYQKVSKGLGYTTIHKIEPKSSARSIPLEFKTYTPESKRKSSFINTNKTKSRRL